MAVPLPFVVKDPQIQANFDALTQQRAFDAGRWETGDVKTTARSTASAGWFICDGSPVSRTTYAGLFAAIGTTYGAGDGLTTFNLPNLKGKVPVGRDAAQVEFDTLGEAGGAKTHTLDVTQLPSHNHGGATGSMNRSNPHGHTIWLMNNGGGAPSVTYVGLGSGSPLRHDGSSFADSTDINHEHAIGAQGGGLPHNILQPYQVLNYVIKF